jgi:site-specific DNA-methyltransferase (adenine-specific)
MEYLESKPCNKFDNGLFFHGDCFDVMKDIPDQSVDMILCDLPYGTTKCSWDTILPFEQLWSEYWRVCKGAIVLTATQPFTSALIMSQVKHHKYNWSWDKVRPTGHLVAKIRPMQQTEDVCVFGKKKLMYNPLMTKRDVPIKGKEGKRTDIMGGVSSGYEATYTHKYPVTHIQFKKDKGFHPTQKPVALFEYLIKTYTEEGMTVLDNCAGSGTTAIACENLGRSWICVEKDETYAKLANTRIKEHINQKNQ